MNEKKLPLKDRHIREILYLLSLSQPISTSKMGTDIGINFRTLKSDLNIVSRYLASRGIKLIKKRRVGVFTKYNPNVDIEDIRKELYSTRDEIEWGRERRFKQIFVDCVTNQKIPTIEDWCFKMGVSRPTVLRDLKRVKNYLLTASISLKGKPGVGYRLEGDEKDLRSAIVKFLLTINKDKIGKLMEIVYGDTGYRGVDPYTRLLLQGLKFPPVKSFLDALQEGTRTFIVDDDYLNLALEVAISILRVKMGHSVTIEPHNLIEIMKDPAYHIAYENKHKIENAYTVRLSPEEVAYITSCFVSSEKQDTTLVSAEEKQSQPDEKYIGYATKVVEIANDVFGVPLLGGDEFIQTLASHLKAAMTKIKYGMKIENPLVEEIKEQYPLAFHIAEKATSILSRKIHANIPPEEAGCIAIHIVVALERSRHQEKKIAVICAMGMGTSRLLFWRLVNEIPNISIVQVGSYRDAIEGRISKHVDLIVSTVPLPGVDTPYVVVSPFLTEYEVDRIKEALGLRSYRKDKWYTKGTKDVIEEDLLFIGLNAKDPKEIIQSIGDILIKKGYVKPGFVEAVIDRERKFPTGLDIPIPVSIPHTEATFSLQRCFAIATLESPVRFKSMGDHNKSLPVRIVFIPVLTVNPEDSIVFQELLKTLVNSKIACKLLKCKSPSEAKTLLVKASAGKIT